MVDDRQVQSVKSPERVLFVGAHPHDEFTIAATLLAHVSAGDEVFASWYTGDDRPEVLALRQKESQAAMALLGIPEDHLEFVSLEPLALPEQLPGTVEAIAATVARVEPTLAYAPAFEGGHPDHDAINFAAWEAIASKGIETREVPLYTGTQRRLWHRLPVFGRFVGSDSEENLRWLTPAEVRFKRELWHVYRSQRPMFDVLLRLSGDERTYFGTERWRYIPLRDYTRPPGERPLFYERGDSPYPFEFFSEAVRQFVWGGGITDGAL
jgi:LmbE family N-acetylglucosaminyl deacetylase